MRPYLEPQDPRLKDIYVTIQALRNSYDLLMRELPFWLRAVVVFVPETEPGAFLHELWGHLGTPDEIVAALLRAGILWKNGQLQVSQEVKDDPHVYEDIASALMAVWKFRTFSEGRFLSFGSSSKTLIAARMLGFGRWGGQRLMCCSGA